jgi:hypothetical protein
MFIPPYPRQIARLRPFALVAIGAVAIAFTLAACAGGSTMRSTGSERQAAIDSLKSDTPPRSTEMARGQCWMKYENTKTAHDLDEKIRLVDQCMAEKKRQYPTFVQ